MSTGVTNTTTISDLLHIAADMARAENRQTEDVLRDALSQYESGKKLSELAAYGRDLTRQTGLKPSDVEYEIAEDRRQQVRRQ